jgi:hypothetical protein
MPGKTSRCRGKAGKDLMLQITNLCLRMHIFWPCCRRTPGVKLPELYEFKNAGKRAINCLSAQNHQVQFLFMRV